jgi:hypothetical protein
MNILRFGTQLLRRSSPFGIILGGAVLALAIPPVRKGFRTVAVAATRGILSITDEAKKITSTSHENMRDIISEAKDPESCCPSCSSFTEGLADLKTKPRRLAVATTMGVLSVSDKAKSLYKDASKQVKSIVDEAKIAKTISDHSENENKESTNNHLSSDDTELPRH